MTVKDSLFQTLDRAAWAFCGGSDYNALSHADRKAGKGLKAVPSCPPSPNIAVTAGPELNYVRWWYTDDSSFKDFVAGGFDFHH